MKIVVYSALFGDKDSLWSVPPVALQGATYVLFTEKSRKEVGLWTDFKGKPVVLFGTNTLRCPQPTWEQRIVEWPYDSRMSARYAKLMSHKLLPKYDYSIWIDSNIRLRIAPKKAIKWLSLGDFAAFKHPDRNCLFQEIEACLSFNKGNKKKLRAQQRAYREARMPKNWSLLSTRSVIRRNTDRVANLNELWWGELLKYSERDQVSLPLVCWRNGFTWSHIPGKALHCNHYWFVRHGRELS